MNDEQFLSLPKAELHLHLRGAMPLEFLKKQLERYSKERVLSTIPAHHWPMLERVSALEGFLRGTDWPIDRIDSLFEFTNLNDFLGTYLFSGYFVRSLDDLAELVKAVLQLLRGQGIVYTEITFSPITLMHHGLDLAELLECVSKTSLSDDIQVRWLIDPVRDLGPERCLELLEIVFRNRFSNIIGVNLGGSEAAYPPHLFKEHFARAKHEGFALTCHAGEAAGPQSVWSAIQDLGATRIGHGVRAIEDPRLVEYLAKQNIPLEVCISSNLATGIYSSLSEHPVRALYNAGVPITLNTDDPTFFQCDLLSEFQLARQVGFSEAELLELIENGFQFAFSKEITTRNPN